MTGRPRTVPRDLAGRRFGRLVAIRRVPAPARVTDQPTRDRREFWRLRCDCGTECVKCHYDLLGGGTRSCGCLQAETRRATTIARNTARATRLTLNGQTRTTPAWAAAAGISPQSLRHRLAIGWPVELALTRPPAPGRAAEAER